MNVAAYLVLIKNTCDQLRSPEYCGPEVVQAIGAIARHETGFATYKPFFRPAKDGAPAFESFNFGAQQCGVIAHGGQCPEHCFPATDTSPTTAGSSIAYLACFQVNDTPEAGISSLVHLVAVQRRGIASSLETGDLQLVAQAMRDARYYEGFGKTQAVRVRNYAIALDRNGQQNARDAHVPYALVLPPDPVPAASASASTSASMSAAAGAPAAPSASTEQPTPDPSLPDPWPADPSAAGAVIASLIVGAIVDLFRHFTRLGRPMTSFPDTLRRLAATLSLGTIVGLFFCVSAACRPLSPAAAPAAPQDELGELGEVLDAAGPILFAVRLGCGTLEASERAVCEQGISALEDALPVAEGLVTTGEACRAQGDQACLAAAILEARRRLPELRRLVTAVEGQR